MRLSAYWTVTASLCLLVACTPAEPQPPHESRLSHSKSPYLRAHADNLVDWYPWGEEAFAAARQQNKPIFLSVGYFTCHWCHVMEKESFMDPTIADLLNRNFIAIKVDREERPDVDRIYMKFLLTQQDGGGWPMSVFLTPQREPFWGGTYLPPRARWGRPGFDEVLQRIHKVWQSQPQQVQADAARFRQQLSLQPEVSARQKLDPALDRVGYEQTLRSYDRVHGGFGAAPKFPTPARLDFLLRYGQRTHQPEATQMALASLEALPLGGIHDLLEGGYHRYSTDALWRVPHFEKMLYDQALLAQVSLDAASLQKDSGWKGMARDILAYVDLRLRDPEGGYYTAEDADSAVEAGSQEHREGAYYTWSEAQLQEVLTPSQLELAARCLGTRPEGNAKSEELQGQNVLYVASSSPPPELLKILREARLKRPRPALDDKIVTSLNGQILVALARAYRVLGDELYAQRARQCVAYLRKNNHSNGKLLHYSRQGPSPVAAFGDDYAELIAGLLELHQATQQVEFLDWACQLQKEQNELFWDATGGGYFETSGQDASILVREKDSSGGPVWSCNARSALNLLHLSQLREEGDDEERAERTLQWLSAEIKDYPAAAPDALCALEAYHGSAQHVVVAGSPRDPKTQAVLRQALAGYHPDRTVIWVDGGERQRAMAAYLPYLKGIGLDARGPTVYLCQNFRCGPPLRDPEEMARALR